MTPVAPPVPTPMDQVAWVMTSVVCWRPVPVQANTFRDTYPSITDA